MKKISVYTICLNEAQHVNRFIQSCFEADEIVICDTGSTDGTIPAVKAWQARHPDKIKLFSITVAPWRFDQARNVSLGLLGADMDIAICLDLDEVLTPDWRPKLIRAWEQAPNTTRLRYKYIWSFNPDGSEGVSYFGDKISARRGYRWHHPAHEVLKPYGIEEYYAFAHGEGMDFEIHHHPDASKSRAQYLKLLELGAHEDPHCDRNAFYHARELYFVGQDEAAVAEFRRYLALPRAVWHLERACGQRLLGTCLARLHRFEEAEAAFLAGIAEAPAAREPYGAAAEFYYNRRDWQKCYDAAIAGLSRYEPEHARYTSDGGVYREKLHDLLAIACYYLGKRDEGRHHAARALRFAPNDARLQKNLGFYG